MPGRRPSAPPALYVNRLAACRSKIKVKGLDGYFVTNRQDQFYLTGFHGEDGGVLILPRKVYLLTDGRFKEEAGAIPWATPIFRSKAMADELALLLKKHKIEKLGIQSEAMTLATHQKLRRPLRPAKLLPVEGLVQSLRLIKDAHEIKTIERAIRVAEGAFKTLMKRLRPGMTERQIAAQLQHEMVRRGASEASFPIIVAEGTNSAKPHAVPGDRKIRVGSAVLIDWGATVDHYRSDLTRVVFIRRIPPRYRKMYDNVLAAQLAGIKAVKPGVQMCDADAAARDTLKQVKMDKWFTHSLGHGLGLDIHEAPRLAARVREKLAEGMVVTVEPGVYDRRTGGVRIEDDVLVTPTGPRVLSKLTKRLEDMVI